MIGHPQASLSDLTQVVYSNDDVTRNLGEIVFECSTVRDKADVRVSNLIGSLVVGILFATLGSVAIAMASATLGLIENHVAALVVVGGTVVLSPIMMVLSYWSGQRQSDRCRFDLHQRGIRYAKHYWQAKDIVAIHEKSSVMGIDERPVAKVIFFFKPGALRGMREFREDTIHFELTDGTKPNLITALSVFKECDVWKLLHRAAALNQEIEFDRQIAMNFDLYEEMESAGAPN